MNNIIIKCIEYEFLGRSLSLQVVDPRWESFSGDNHASGRREVWLRIVLDLEVDNLAGLQGNELRALTSMGPGSLEASEKLALSKVTTNSHFSLRGFLKSMPAGLAPGGHFTGP